MSLLLILITVAYLVVGAIAGVLATLFGFGGGFIVVPVVLLHMRALGLGDDAATHIAIATSLAVMIFNAANATQAHARRGNIHWPIYVHLAPYVVVGAVIGVAGAGWLDGATLRGLFVAFLVLTVLSAAVRKDLINVDTAGFRWPPLWLRGVFGTLLGVIAGALGVGGSVLSVPFLRRRGLAMKQAAALASPLSLPVSIAGTATVLIIGAQGLDVAPASLELIYLPAVIGIAIGTLVGVPLGVRVAHRLPDRLYAVIYTALLAVTALIVALGG